jgi:hypothetical protein
MESLSIILKFSIGDSKMIINKIDIAAMKKATNINFRHVNGVSQIEACKNPSNEEKEKNPFVVGQCIVIPVGMEIRDYGSPKLPYNNVQDSFKAFEMIDYSNYDTAWQTICSFLKEGDYIYLVWERDAFTNGCLKENNLHGDKVSLKVIRGNKQFSFFINSCVRHDNLARMIQMI